MLLPPPDDRDPLLVKEGLHWQALYTEYTALWARGALQCARNFASVEVTPVSGEAPPGRFTVPELLVDHERVLVVGGEGAGKTTLVAHLVFHARLRGRAGEAAKLLPFVVAVELLQPHERLTLATLARLSPAAGAPVLERALAARRALIIVDGLDRAPGGPSALLESITAFAGAHAGNRFVVTTRPPATGLPGLRRTAPPGFLTTAILPPLPPSRVLPAYRFVGLRSPERKTALYLEHVETLLRAWEPAALPPGSALSRISPRDLRELLSRIAMRMHEHRDYEIDRGSLTKEIGRSRPPELAPAVVGEIRAHPGLLVERRPGRFVFADLVLQEVLVAERVARREGLASFVSLRDDLWWHGVIELAAGLPGVDSAALVVALLDADDGDAAVTSVLAARCAESAPSLPERARRSVARRFNALVPPEDLVAADRLVEIGDLAGPAVLRGMRRGDPTQRALSALVLGRIHHEPACGALIALASDPARVEGQVTWSVAGAWLELTGEPVATSALAGLLCLAQVSTMGRRAFARGLSRAPRKSVQQLYDHLERKRHNVWVGELDPDRDERLMASLQEQVLASLRRWERGDLLRPR